MADDGGAGRIGVAIVGHTAWITIDNPRKRNAMGAAMWRRIPEVLDGIDAAGAVRSVVLTGAGTTFCAGADITELGAISGNGSGEDASVAAEHALLSCPLPTIALIDGHCVGGGCQLAAACDIRIATPAALFGITPAKLGIVYPQSSVRRLTEVVGASAAKLLLFSGEIVGADRARELRLVDEVVPNARDRVESLTATIAARSRLTVEASKELVDLAARDAPLDERARHWQSLSASSGESAEGIAAFVERRTPVFPYGRS
ncbi:enoyl-CoA hydratase/carnithine racemase [Murinocardiopsis flavida]|uniref:Enoyl-CoA hydratase/carnithine racemase n=1 Tax=Murinocardiopsis flavida TaxID=645275 RepID=A0A2P8DRS7_9ACTN|nr:enoyl-CoA hydratase/isomerase family protein [Murinocardiopsis flavida]PSK99918.1 enoyl-CoA hydratase/carnithine racemase [Murinocardiopsis flavida]